MRALLLVRLRIELTAKSIEYQLKLAGSAVTQRHRTFRGDQLLHRPIERLLVSNALADHALTQLDYIGLSKHAFNSSALKRRIYLAQGENPTVEHRTKSF